MRFNGDAQFLYLRRQHRRRDGGQHPLIALPRQLGGQLDGVDAPGHRDPLVQLAPRVRLEHLLRAPREPPARGQRGDDSSGGKRFGRVRLDVHDQGGALTGLIPVERGHEAPLGLEGKDVDARAARLRGERKPVTAIFADVVGSTTLAENMDPEEWTALMNAAVALFIYTLVPEFLMRFIVWMLIHSIYRLEKSGLENIPDEGAALVAGNHLSFSDHFLMPAILALCEETRIPLRSLGGVAVEQVACLLIVLNHAYRVKIAGVENGLNIISACGAVIEVHDG